VAAGYSFVELLFVIGLLATLSVIAVPATLAGLDDSRTVGAARYIAARLQRARMEAVMRSADVGVRFTLSNGKYAYAVYVDGNSNGIRSADITRGVDRLLMPAERLADQFTNVDFGALPGLPPVDSVGPSPGSDPIRLGSSNIASFSANGTSSSGSLYIRGRQAQYVVRLFGDTARSRIFRFDAPTNQWKLL
jgi:type II secretory pathway pseudopilin PulG